MDKRIRVGSVIRQGGVTPWPHEEHSATALAKAGYTVKFIPANSTLRTADVFLNNTQFEMKAPCGHNIDCIERNLKRALAKCPNIVIDSCRMKNVTDRSICNVLANRLRKGRGLKRLIFVRRNGEVVDINRLI